MVNEAGLSTHQSLNLSSEKWQWVNDLIVDRENCMHKVDFRSSF